MPPIRGEPELSALDDHLPYALTQFKSEVIVPLDFFGMNVSFTTASSAMLTTTLLVGGYLVLAVRERSLVPGRLQASAEMLYTFVADTVTNVAGRDARPSIPFLFTMFVFILFGTLLGLTPIKETFTSHLVVTMALALMVFTHVNVVAFRRYGVGFLRILLPAGVPMFVAPILVLVELVSYLFRPVTLGFRIFANIVAGHIMLKLFGDFCSMLVEAFGLTGAAGSIFILPVMVVLLAMEIMIVCIQSYIFILISSMYLRDALHTH